MLFQSKLLIEISGSNFGDWRDLFVGTMKSLYGSVVIPTSDDIVTKLLSSSGMYGMLDTIWLVICAMIFGGVIEKAGFLEKIISIILNKIKFLIWAFLASTTIATVSGLIGLYTGFNPLKFKNACHPTRACGLYGMYMTYGYGINFFMVIVTGFLFYKNKCFKGTIW